MSGFSGNNFQYEKLFTTWQSKSPEHPYTQLVYMGVRGHLLGDARCFSSSLKESALPRTVDGRPSGERAAGIVSVSVQILI